MVTVKKHHLATIKKYGNYMPMSSSQYQLSINYIYKFQTKWTYDVFKESYDVFVRLLQWYSEHKNTDSLEKQETSFNGAEIPVSSGVVTVMHDLLARNQIDFDIEMPEQIIMLDARYQGKDETYFRVAQRYQDILTRLYRFKFENIDATQNTEIAGFETDITSCETQENSLKRKRSIENDDSEEPTSKISCKNEESNGKKHGNQSQQDKDASLEDKRSLEKSDKCEVNSKNRSHEQSNKKTLTNRSSRKRPANIEEDSVNEEQFLKRARLNSEDSVDFEDSEENEELKILEKELYEDLESIEKIFSDSSKSFKPMNELKEQMEEGIFLKL